MSKVSHEIRDPVHSFIKLDSDERRIIDSRPFQRLRHIHQLAMTYMVYPGATHRRFEHSLGVMELATRVYDVITSSLNVHPRVQKLLPQIVSREKKSYWRRVLRIAALCHDMGHLPFSHAAESDLLPENWSHETLTVRIIESEEMAEICQSITPPIRPKDVVKLAVGPKELVHITFDDWETILAEIIVGNAFGVDRMDYLLRDSYHAGVAYGRFDHYRLIDTLRILPRSDDSNELSLGMEEGGLHSAEALLLARYFMFAQLYYHPIRRVYDIHLQDFLKEWLDGGRFKTSITSLLSMTDNDVLVAMAEASREPKRPGHEWASRIAERRHFRLLYQRNPADVIENPDAAEAVYDAACLKFGKERVRFDRYFQEGTPSDFPILARDGRITSSMLLSKVIPEIPVVAFEYVFISPEVRERAEEWLENNRERIIRLYGEEV